MRLWDELVCEILKVPVFVGRVFFILIRNLGFQKWLCYLKPVRNIPKFKDRANWSRDTFQPMRRRACVYQQTNQNIAPVIKNLKNNGRSQTESVIVSRLSGIFLRLFMMRHIIFLSGQRIGSYIGSVSWNIQHILWFILLLSFKQRNVWARFWSVFKVGEHVSIIFSIHRFFTKF